jgi:hypothetical protein
MPPRTPKTQSADGAIALEDFFAFAPTHTYIYRPCREFWPAETVNSILPPQIELDANGQPLKAGGKIVKTKPSVWLDRNRRIEQMTWMPGLPEIVRDKHVVDGGWFDRPGGKVLNLYRPPRINPGDSTKAAGQPVRNLQPIREVSDLAGERGARPGRG